VPDLNICATVGRSSAKQVGSVSIQLTVHSAIAQKEDFGIKELGGIAVSAWMKR